MLYTTPIDSSSDFLAEIDADTTTDVMTVINEMILSEYEYGYWDWSVDNAVNFMSKSLIELLGYEEQELENNHEIWKSLVLPEDLPKVEQLNAALLSSKSIDSLNNELRYCRKDGTVIDILSKARVVARNSEGYPSRIVGCNINITKSKKLELYSTRQAQLAQLSLSVNNQFELNALLKNIAEVTDKYVPASGGASVILWNKVTEEFSTSATTVPGQDGTIACKRVRRSNGATRWIVDNKQPFIVENTEFDPFTANGLLPEYGLQAYAGIPLLFEDEVLGVLYAMDYHPRKYSQHDIDFMTELAARASLAIIKVRMYEELQTSYRELEHFSYSVSHDLKSPLLAIDGFSSIIMEDCADVVSEDALKYLAKIKQSVSRMAGIIENIMRISKVSFQEIISTMVNITELTNFLVEELHAQSPDRHVQVVVEENLMMARDKQLLTLVMQNLLNNAWKFTSHSISPLIEVGYSVIDDQTYIFVKDNGIGFDVKKNEDLFKEFTRMDSSMGFQGSGIGLSIVKKIISRHHGEIISSSSLGNGATFFFRT